MQVERILGISATKLSAEAKPQLQLVGIVSQVKRLPEGLPLLRCGFTWGDGL
jgi:hypothetical protein